MGKRKKREFKRLVQYNKKYCADGDLYPMPRELELDCYLATRPGSVLARMRLGKLRSQNGFATNGVAGAGKRR